MLMKRNNNHDTNKCVCTLKETAIKIVIGGIAIFTVLCYELWNNSNISNIMVVVLSFATAMVISILGFLFCKFVFYRNSDKWLCINIERN